MNVQWNETQFFWTEDSMDSAPRSWCFSLLRCWGKHPKIRALGGSHDRLWLNQHLGADFPSTFESPALSLAVWLRNEGSQPLFPAFFNGEAFTGSQIPLNFFHTWGSLYVKCDYVTFSNDNSVNALKLASSLSCLYVCHIFFFYYRSLADAYSSMYFTIIFLVCLLLLAVAVLIVVVVFMLKAEFIFCPPWTESSESVLISSFP